MSSLNNNSNKTKPSIEKESILRDALKECLPEEHWFFKFLPSALEEFDAETVLLAFSSSGVKVQLELISWDNELLDLFLIENPHLTEAAQLLLYGRDDYDIKYYLAQYSNLCLKAQRLLAVSDDTDVRSMLAINRNLASETHRTLAKDPNVHVQGDLARNPSVSLTEDFPVSFLFSFKKEFVDKRFAELSKEQLELALSFIDTCTGSLKDLLKMVQLI